MSVRRILVGADPSENSRRAIEWAAELAADLGAEAVAVHVYEPMEHLAEIGPDTSFAEVKDRLVETLREVWDEPFVRRDVPVSCQVVEGAPHEALLAVARETGADLVVVGARRLGPVKRLALGSTSARLLRDAHLPVTVIHSD